MMWCECEKCGEKFKPGNHPVTKLAATAAGGATGAYVGSGIGLATGGTAMAATIPLGVIGAVSGFVAQGQFTKCPQCGKVFKV